MPLLDDAPGPLGSLLRRRRAYVVPEWRLLYVSLAKNACTSLKWLVADLAGEDPADFVPRLGHETTFEEAIHVRGHWRKVPLLKDLSDDQRAGISPDNGWFVFAVVRDPRARLFSAWQNKFLLRNPRYVEHADQPWYPRVPDSADDVVADYAAFVRMLEADPAHRLHQDSHFAKQTLLLGRADVPYTRIYDISELTELQSDLAGHLAAQGRPEPPALRRANDTPLVANGQVLEPGIRETVEKLFAEDFDRFGHRWDLARLQSRPDWSGDALRHVQAVIAHNERITQLREIGLEAARAQRAASERAGRLEKRVGELERALAEARTPTPWTADRIVQGVRRRLHRTPPAT